MNPVMNRLGQDHARLAGLLDLLDSIIFTGPIAYLLWLALPLSA